MNKLIFLDIDGTLTIPGSNVPPESAMTAIRKAQAAGNKVFICTGRNPDMAQPVLDLGFDGSVCCGGGYVLAGDEVLYDCPMTDEQREKAMRLFKENGVFRTVEAKDGSFCDEGLPEFLMQASGGNSELMRWRVALEKELRIQMMDNYDNRPIYKVVFMCKDKEQLKPVMEALQDEFNFVLQEMAFAKVLNGELVNKKFDKGTGVRLVADKLRIPIEDTYGFGDSMNDLEMIETVGTSVCMDNGAAALKEISDIVCPAVEEDGLYKAFEQLGLME